MELLLQRYLAEKYNQTAYATNVYLAPGPLAPRLTRVTRENLKTMPGLKIECTFRTRAHHSKNDGKPGPSKAKPKPSNGPTQTASSQTAGVKRKRRPVTAILCDDVDDDEDFEPAFQKYNKSGARDSDDDSDDDEIVDDWSHTMRSDFPPPKRRKSRQDEKHNMTMTRKAREVLVLSD